MDVGSAMKKYAKAATKAANLKNLAAFVQGTTILKIVGEGGQGFSGLSTKAAKWHDGSESLGRLRGVAGKFRVWARRPRRGRILLFVQVFLS